MREGDRWREEEAARAEGKGEGHSIQTRTLEASEEVERESGWTRACAMRAPLEWLTFPSNPFNSLFPIRGRRSVQDALAARFSLQQHCT